MVEVTNRRGSYRKGLERREQIVRTAVEVFGQQGYRSGSIREIAKRVGLTPAGLTHHFGSKEELLAEVVRHRDAMIADSVRASGAAGLAAATTAVVAYNQQNPGLTSLFTVLAAEATSPEHPAHAYFAERYAAQRRHGLRTLGGGEEAGTLLPGADPDLVLQLVGAVMDGLQIQMLLNPGQSMEPAFEQFMAVFFPGAPTADVSPENKPPQSVEQG